MTFTNVRGTEASWEGEAKTPTKNKTIDLVRQHVCDHLTHLLARREQWKQECGRPRPATSPTRIRCMAERLEGHLWRTSQSQGVTLDKYADMSTLRTRLAAVAERLDVEMTARRSTRNDTTAIAGGDEGGVAVEEGERGRGVKRPRVEAPVRVEDDDDDEVVADDCEQHMCAEEQCPEAITPLIWRVQTPAAVVPAAGREVGCVRGKKRRVTEAEVVMQKDGVIVRPRHSCGSCSNDIDRRNAFCRSDSPPQASHMTWRQWATIVIWLRTSAQMRILNKYV